MDRETKKSSADIPLKFTILFWDINGDMACLGVQIYPNILNSDKKINGGIS